MTLFLRTMLAFSPVTLITGGIALTHPTAIARPSAPSVASNLNLTAGQEEQLQQIGRETQTQVEAILTPQQRNQLRRQMSQNQRSGNLQSALNSLNLTTKQRSQLARIQQAARQRIEAILTPEQLQQLRQAHTRQVMESGFR